MGDINKTTFFYRKKFQSKEAEFNKPMQLPAYFGSMIGDKKQVKIAEVGAGPINTIGDSWPGVDVLIDASDIHANEYQKFWEHHNKTPIIPVVYQDFEDLDYADETFDIVHCVNALDHTADAMKALSELIRICKKGGWIYLRHSPYQMDRYGGLHRWNAHVVDGVCVFSNGIENLKLDGFKTHLEGDLIVSIWQKI